MKYFLLALVIVLLINACNNSKNTQLVTSISAQELKNKIDENQSLYIIDVRSENEFYGKVGHIKKSELIPLQKIANSITELNKIDDTIYVVCLSGKRSAIAAKILRGNGLDAVNIKGGMLAWNKLN